MRIKRALRWITLAGLAVAGGAPAPVGGQAVSGRGFGESLVGFQDVNGNGVLDCLEPVTIRAFYIDPSSDTATGSITGRMVVPAAGAAGLAFIPGSVEIDPVFSAGDCGAAIVSGNAPGDASAIVDFACGPPQPGSGQTGQRSNVVAFLYRAAFTAAQPFYTAAMHGTTSDGLDAMPQLTESGGIGATCAGAGADVTVSKSAAGTGVPGSTLLYTISATDQSGLGLGGLQLTEVVPMNTVFDAAASSPGWVCAAATAGAMCRLAAGNIGPDATVTRFFAVDLVPALPAGVASVSNTACARSGPSTVVGCASVSTPTAGQAVLTLAKSLASGAGTPGATVVYDLKVVNGGTQDSGPVTLTETVPADTTWVPGGGWTCGGGGGPGSACTLLLGNVPAAGGAATAQFTVAVASPLPAGVTAIANTACAAIAAESAGATTVASATNATVATHGTIGTRAANATKVTNTTTAAGATNAANTAKTATASSTAGAASAAKSGNTANAGNAARAAFATSASQAPARAPGVARSAQAPACSSLTLPTTGRPLLSVNKTAAGSGAPGSTLVYSIAVQNTGNQDAAGVAVSETVPGLTSYDAAHSSAAWSCAGTAPGAACTANLTSLPAGATTVLAFAVTIASPLPAGAAAIANQACASAPGVPAACGATATPTTGQASLRLAKTYAGGAVVPNAVLVFQLAVANTGNQDLGAAVVTETVPPLASFAAAASDPRWSCTGTAPGSACTLDLAGVPAGSSQTIAFAVRAAASLPAAAVISNAACVTGAAAAPEAAVGSARRALHLRAAAASALGAEADGRGARQRRAARNAPAAGEAGAARTAGSAGAMSLAPATGVTAEASAAEAAGARLTAAPQACGTAESPAALALDTTLAAEVVGHSGAAVPGDRIHYTLTVPNANGAVALNLVAAASLDANTALVAGTVTATQGAVTTGDGAHDATVVVALGDLAAGATATVEWEVTLNSHLPAGVAEVAAQAETTGANLPPDESGPPPPPSTPGPTETPVAAQVLPPPAAPQAIPTLGGWGLGTMTVLLGGVAAAALRRRFAGQAEARWRDLSRQP